SSLFLGLSSLAIVLYVNAATAVEKPGRGVRAASGPSSANQPAAVQRGLPRLLAQADEAATTKPEDAKPEAKPEQAPNTADKKQSKESADKAEKSRADEKEKKPTPALLALQHARDRMAELKSVRANIVEKVSIIDHSFTAKGSYLQ